MPSGPSKKGEKKNNKSSNNIEEQPSAASLNMASLQAGLMAGKGGGNDVFQQLWQGIAQLQAESGDSAQLVKEKERELESAFNQIENITDENEKLKSKEKELSENIVKLNAGLELERKENTRLNVEIKLHKETSSKFIKELEVEKMGMKKEIQTLREENKKFVSDLASLRQNLETLQNDKKAVETDIQKQCNLVEESKQSVSRLQEKYEGDIAKLKDKIKSHVDENETLHHDLIKLHEQIKGLESSRDQMKISLEVAEAALAKAQSERDAAADAKSEIDDKMKAVNEKLLEKIRDTELSYSNREKIHEEEKSLLSLKISKLDAELRKMEDSTAEALRLREEFEKKSQEIANETSEKLEKMRYAMRQVQDKHLQDIIRFDTDRKSWEGQLQKEKDLNTQLEKDCDSHKSKLDQIMQNTKQESAKSKEAMGNALASTEKQYQDKVSKLMDAHMQEISKLNEKLTELGASKRKELQEAEDYKQRFLKEAKDSHTRLTEEIERLTKELSESRQKYKVLIDENQTSKDQFEEQRKKLQESVDNAELKALEAGKSREMTDEQLLVIQSNHKRESEKMLFEITRLQDRNKKLEDDKRDLVLDCKKINDEFTKSTTALSEAQKKIKERQLQNIELEQEILKLSSQIQEFDAEKDERVRKLMEANRVLQAQKNEIQSDFQSLRQELSSSKKNASEQVASFSAHARQLESNMAGLQHELGISQTKLVDATKKIQGLEENVKNLRGQLDEAKMRNAADADSMNRQVDEAIKAKNDQLDNVKRLTKLVETKDEEMEELSRRLRASKTNMQNQVQTFKDTELAKQQLQEQLNKEQEKVRLLKDEIELRKQENNQLTKEVLDSKNEKATRDHEFHFKESTYCKTIETLKEQLQQSQSTIAEHNKEIKSLNAAVSSSKYAGQEAEVRFASKLATVETDLNTAMKKLKRELEAKEEQLEDEVKTSEKLTKRFTADLERKSEEIKQLQDALRAAQENGISMLRDLEVRMEESDNIRNENDTIIQTLTALEKRYEATELRCSTLQSELEREKARHNETRKSLQDTDATNKNNVKSTHERLEAVTKQLEVVLQEKEFAENETGIRISALKRSVDALEAEITRKDNELTNAESRLKAMIEEQAMIQESANRAIMTVRQQSSEEQNKLQSELEQSRQTADQAAELCAQMDQEREDLQTKIQSLSSHLEKQASALDELQSERDKLQQNYNTTVAEKRKLETENKRMAFELSGVRHSKLPSEREDLDELLSHAEKEGYESAQAKMEKRIAAMELEHQEEIEMYKKKMEQLGRSSLNMLEPPDGLEVSHDYVESKSPDGSAAQSKHVDGRVASPSTTIRDTNEFLNRRRKKLNNVTELKSRSSKDAAEDVKFPSLK